jgi:hypothetical protein
LSEPLSAPVAQRPGGKKYDYNNGIMPMRYIPNAFLPKRNPLQCIFCQKGIQICNIPISVTRIIRVKTMVVTAIVPYLQPYLPSIPQHSKDDRWRLRSGQPDGCSRFRSGRTDVHSHYLLILSFSVMFRGMLVSATFKF